MHFTISLCIVFITTKKKEEFMQITLLTDCRYDVGLNVFVNDVFADVKMEIQIYYNKTIIIMYSIVMVFLKFLTYFEVTTHLATLSDTNTR